MWTLQSIRGGTERILSIHYCNRGPSEKYSLSPGRLLLVEGTNRTRYLLRLYQTIEALP